MVVVALTGWGQDDDRERSRYAGFDAHVVKPVGHDTLVRLLGDLRDRRGHPRRAGT
jgi:CheY-like chemotaxis protein